jgi:hypothetical protein
MIMALLILSKLVMGFKIDIKEDIYILIYILYSIIILNATIAEYPILDFFF